MHHDHMGSAQDVIGQLWKEYAKSDSRYLVSDSFVVSIETITVVSLGICLDVPVSRNRADRALGFRYSGAHYVSLLHI